MSKKFTFYLVIFYFFCTTNAASQIADSSVTTLFNKIIQLIKSDNIIELSNYINYPLRRRNPLPDIVNKSEFIRAYPILFDSAFKVRLMSYSDSDVFEHHGAYGLVGGEFAGDLWMDDNGKLDAINYSSKAEQAIRDNLIEQQKKRMHASVCNWDSNILVARSKKLLIRIDRVNNTIRYASWSKGKTQSDKPDIIINNGVEEAQGTMGGWHWTFENNGWTYLIDDVEMAESDDILGFYLIVSNKGKEISSTKLTELR